MMSAREEIAPDLKPNAAIAAGDNEPIDDLGSPARDRRRRAAGRAECQPLTFP
jgi:hypothetical protein